MTVNYILILTLILLCHTVEMQILYPTNSEGTGMTICIYVEIVTLNI